MVVLQDLQLRAWLNIWEVQAAQMGVLHPLFPRMLVVMVFQVRRLADVRLLLLLLLLLVSIVLLLVLVVLLLASVVLVVLLLASVVMVVLLLVLVVLLLLFVLLVLFVLLQVLVVLVVLLLLVVMVVLVLVQVLMLVVLLVFQVMLLVVTVEAPLARLPMLRLLHLLLKVEGTTRSRIQLLSLEVVLEAGMKAPSDLLLLQTTESVAAP